MLGSAPRIAGKRPADQVGMGGGYASRCGVVDDPVPWRTIHSLKLKMPFLGYPPPIIFRGGGPYESTHMKNTPDLKPKICCNCGVTCWSPVTEIPYCKSCKKMVMRRSKSPDEAEWLAKYASELDDLEHKFV